MDEERLKRIRANIAKHEERKKTQNIMGDIDSSKLDRSNTSYNKNDTNSAIIVIEIILFGSFDFRKSRHLNSCRFSIKTQCFWHIVSFLCSKMC